MPRRHRLFFETGLVFHVLNRGAKRAVLFHEDDDYDSFVGLLRAAVSRFKVAVYAYCLMPNHWHVVIAPGSGHELSRFMHWLTVMHASHWHVKRDSVGQGAVYQGRFKAIPVGTDHHFLRLVRYVERNAMQAGIVNRAEDWRWSSLSRRGIDACWLSDWPVPRPDDWIDEVNATPPPAELEAIRTAVAHSVPFGDPAWRLSVSTQLRGRKPRRRGRPPRTVLNK